MTAPGDYPGGKKGDELTVEFTVLGRSFVGLNGGPNFKPNEAVSFMVVTEDQAETDRYWNAIVGNGGAGKRVRLVQGRWGFSWQITPRVLLEGDHRARPGGGQARVRGDDDDAEDRHRQDRGRASRGEPPMRKIIGAAFVSLDGVMQAPAARPRTRPAASASAAGCPQFFDEDVGEAIDDLFGGRLRPAARPAHLRHFRRLLALVGEHRIDEFDDGRMTASAASSASQQICADPRRRAARLGEQPPRRRHRRAARDQARRRPRPAHPGQQHALSRSCSRRGCSTG